MNSLSYHHLTGNEEVKAKADSSDETITMTVSVNHMSQVAIFNLSYQQAEALRDTLTESMLRLQNDARNEDNSIPPSCNAT